LLLEHGLRVGEIAILTRQAFDLKAGTLSIYRPKVDIHQTHTLTGNTRRAAKAYLENDAPADGSIWVATCKGTGKIAKDKKTGKDKQLSVASATRALTKRVELLGRHAGVEGLSAHDGRHYWATYEARNGTAMDRLKQAGGWSSLAMPNRYIIDAQIANEGTARVKQS
jgi:integrase